jgi:hypothetical protein
MAACVFWQTPERAAISSPRQSVSQIVTRPVWESWREERGGGQFAMVPAPGPRLELCRSDLTAELHSSSCSTIGRAVVEAVEL